MQIIQGKNLHKFFKTESELSFKRSERAIKDYKKARETERNNAGDL
jgi:hypothetical protein